MESKLNKPLVHSYYLVAAACGVYLFLIPVLISFLKTYDPILDIRVLLASILMALLVPYIDRLIDSDETNPKSN